MFAVTKKDQVLNLKYTWFIQMKQIFIKWYIPLDSILYLWCRTFQVAVFVQNTTCESCIKITTLGWCQAISSKSKYLILVFPLCFPNVPYFPSSVSLITNTSIEVVISLSTVEHFINLSGFGEKGRWYICSKPEFGWCANNNSMEIRQYCRSRDTSDGMAQYMMTWQDISVQSNLANSSKIDCRQVC